MGEGKEWRENYWLYRVLQKQTHIKPENLFEYPISCSASLMELEMKMFVLESG